MREVQATLETVQNQRNELRQQLKDAKAAAADAERRAQQVRHSTWLTIELHRASCTVRRLAADLLRLCCKRFKGVGALAARASAKLAGCAEVLWELLSMAWSALQWSADFFASPVRL